MHAPLILTAVDAATSARASTDVAVINSIVIVAHNVLYALFMVKFAKKKQDITPPSCPGLAKACANEGVEAAGPWPSMGVGVWREHGSLRWRGHWFGAGHRHWGTGWDDWWGVRVR